MNVLQVYKTRYPRIEGGVDAVVTSLLEHREPRFQATLLRMADWSVEDLETETVNDVTVHSIHLPLPPSRGGLLKGWWFFLQRAPGALMRLRRLVQDESIDVVHLHTLQLYQIYFVALRALGGPPYILTLHGSEVRVFGSRSRLTRWAWAKVLRQASAVTAVSRWLAAEAEKTLPCASPVHPVPNGIAQNRRVPGSATVTNHVKLPAEYLVMIGAFKAVKGHDVAFKALSLLSSKLDHVSLVLVGSGALHQHYLELVASLGVAHRVHFTGQLGSDAIPSVLEKSIAMILPSRNEGQSIILLEAARAGVVPICSDIGPIREIVRHGETGFLFPPDDARALATQIERVVLDPGLRKKLASACSAYVHRHYSVETMISRYQQLYAQCCPSI